ncbi:MAG: nucleotidyltransferase domain-containing protein [Gammaproteobacteria bacterium]|nr:nucleotidyltransferase domain-containing protein [Gammaproteobacteria bacterium]
MNPQVILPDSKQLAAFFRNNDILKLAVYGSALRNDFGPDSDIDLLVKFKPGAQVGLFKVVGLEKALSSFFGQRKMDLCALGDLSP